MKLRNNYIIIALVALPYFFKAQLWQQLNNFAGTERDDGVVFLLGNKAYAGTGLQTGFTATRDFYVMDLLSNTWSAVASMPAGMERQYACAFSYNDTGYVFGGITGGGTVLNDLWAYAPGSDTWIQKTSKPGSGVSGGASFTINDKAYIVGGSPGGAAIGSEVWELDLTTKTWTQKNNVPFNGCWRHSATSVNGKGYVIFGRSNTGAFRTDMFEYDPGTDTWTSKGNFPLYGRAYSSLQNINNELVIFGGNDSLNTHYNNLWTYNLTLQTWNQKNPLPGAGRKGGMSFVWNFTLYYTCGIDQGNNRLKETWRALFPVGINESGSETGPRIYPNPASDRITIDLPAGYEAQTWTYSINDMPGKTVLAGELEKNCQVKTGALLPGIYLLNLSSAAGTYTSKLIIQ